MNNKRRQDISPGIEGCCFSRGGLISLGGIISLFILLVLPLGVTSREESRARQFQDRLAGEWHGRAVHTPIGPAPYDIDFKWLDGDCLSGTAYNGFSHHTWKFCRQEDNLKLDFLSDFRGNDQPIFFKQIAIESDTVTFMADSHRFMRVMLTIGDEFGRIKIIHHGELHVQIRLER